MGVLHAVTAALTVQIAGASVTSRTANSRLQAYEETLRSPPVPTNYSVTSVRAHPIASCQSSYSHLRRGVFARSR